jgi:hypothetical protein
MKNNLQNQRKLNLFSVSIESVQLFRHWFDPIVPAYRCNVGIFLLAMIISSNTQANNINEVLFDPSIKTVSLGESFSLELIGRNFTSVLDGGAVDIFFDKNILNVTSIVIDNIWDFNPVSGTIDNSSGNVSDIEFNSFFNNNSGDFNIALINFKAMSNGSSGIYLHENLNNPFASGGEPLAVSFTSGSISVPEPPTIFLIGLAIAWIATKSRAQG